MEAEKPKTVKYGSIYWILYPYKVILSDLVHPTMLGPDALFCPNLNENNVCLISNPDPSAVTIECAFSGERTSETVSCPYDDYHKYFVITDLPSLRNIKCPRAQFHRENGYRDSAINMGEGANQRDLALAMYYFPQHDLCKMSKNETRKNVVIDNDDASEEHKEQNKEGFWRIQSPVNPASTYKYGHQNFYAASEFVLWQDKDDSLAESAFLKLTTMDVVDRHLPDAGFAENKDSYIPIAFSFFGDAKADGFLAIMIRDERNLERNWQEPTKTEKLVSQALASLNEPIKRQREMFLYYWCQRLRLRVSDLFNEKVKDVDVEEPGYRNKIDDAKKEAVKDGAEALQRMILVLLAEKDAVYKETMFNEKLFEPKALKEGICSTLDFNCLKDSGRKTKDKYKDRCTFICEFCRQAKISIIEGLGAGKLKGALSRDASAALMDIAKDDPVKARVLIRGEAGGGKGVAAEDFHAHCMEHIARELKDEWEDCKKDFSNIDHDTLIKWAACFAERSKEDTDIKSAVVFDYFSGIHTALSGIEKLPSFASGKIKSNDEKLEFLNEQVVGTAWWLWRVVVPDDKSKQTYAIALNNCLDALAKNSSTVEFKHLFIGALALKILHELIYKKDWSFNLFQVNCGIMGGQNSELAESIRRLFGQTDAGKACTALPGLFQICSYVGGTLFLDEIADAPVRIQDNLLRPLEEGKVSRPGWETINENVKNIRIIGATFKDLFKLADQYRETVSSGNPKGFRPDLLTRLTRNPPVTITPVWHHFVPSARYNLQAMRNQFCYVMAEATAKHELSPKFWDDVYLRIIKKLDAHCTIAIGHLPDEIDRRRHFASKVTMRLLKALAERAATTKDKSKLDPSIAGHLDRMLDYLLCDS